MDWSQLLPVLGIGSIIGGVIGGYFQSQFQHRRQVKEWEHELKKKRYLCINLLLLAKLEAKDNLSNLTMNRPDIKNEADLDKEIQTEYFNSFVFASMDVISSLASFIKKPDYLQYCKVASAIRIDLWNNKENLMWKLKIDHIRLHRKETAKVN